MRCPPYSADHLPEMAADVLVLKLHGIENANGLWGEDEDDGPLLALEARQVAMLDLQATAVFALVCDFADTDMVEAFRQAGTAALIGSDEPQGGGGNTLSGTDIVASRFCEAMGAGKTVGEALSYAKQDWRLWLTLSGWRTRSLKVLWGQDWRIRNV